MGFMDDMKNKATEIKGKAKEVAGEITGDHELRAEGKLDQAEGKVKEFASAAGDKLEDAKDATVEGAKKLGADVSAAAEKIKEKFSSEES